MATTHNDLGILYKDMGAWDDAIEYFKQSQKNLDTLGDKQGKAAAFNSLGFLYIDRQDWENAKMNFERAHKIWEEIGNQRRKAETSQKPWNSLQRKRRLGKSS